MDVQAAWPMCELPSRGDTSHCSTDGSCQPAQGLHCLLQAGCSSCRAGVHSSAAERRKMKGGHEQSPRQGRWLLGEAGGLAESSPRHRAGGSEIAGGRVKAGDISTWPWEMPNQTTGHCMEICTRKSCRRSTEHLGFSAYRGIWSIRQDHAILSLLHIFSVG